MSAIPIAPPKSPTPSDLGELQACLPAALRGPSVAIARIAAGMSGAGVYRVDAVGTSFVLKITPPEEPILGWRNRLLVQRAAAELGMAPRIEHVDEPRRAVLSELITDRSFSALLGTPATRDAAIVALGELLGKRRGLPIPTGMEVANPAAALQGMWIAMPSTFPLPSFVHDAVQSLLVVRPPTSAASVLMSHNDLNPTNLVFDGARLMLLDWQVAAPNDPLYDLAAISMFFRLDDATVRQLIAAHDGVPVDEVPNAFRYYRRCAAVLCGIGMLHAARARGHQGGEAAIDETRSLSEVYQEMRSGSLNVASADGQWALGLALLKEGTAT